MLFWEGFGMVGLEPWKFCIYTFIDQNYVCVTNGYNYTFIAFEMHAGSLDLEMSPNVCGLQLQDTDTSRIPVIKLKMRYYPYKFNRISKWQ